MFLEQLSNKPVLHYHCVDRKERYSVTFHKGYKLFSCVQVNREKAVLQGPYSAVELHIPEGLHGFISGHAHTDPTPFLNVIPESECLVSPIVEYNCSFTKNSPEGLFEIKVPHCVRNRKQFQHIRVRHGDIYSNLPFSAIDSFSVDEDFITIITSRFSQYICTAAGCRESCTGNAKAFILWPHHPPQIPSNQISSEDLHVQPSV